MAKLAHIDGASVQRARINRGYTQADLAVAASLTRNTIGRIERGDHVDVLISTVAALADALGVRIASLLIDANKEDAA